MGVPRAGLGARPQVRGAERGACREGWGRTRSRPLRILFPMGPGILGAKAKGGDGGIIKEGGLGGGREMSPHRIGDPCASSSPGSRSSGPPPSSPAGGACGVFAAPCGVCGGGAGGGGGCAGGGGAAALGATAWLTGAREGTRGGEEPRPLDNPPPAAELPRLVPTHVLCRGFWAGPTCRCCGT